MIQDMLFEEKNDNWESVRDNGGLFFVSHSGGKDSQAMYAHLVSDLEIPLEQIIVIHAHLGEIEWDGIRDHISDTIRHDLNVVQAVDKFGELRSFISIVEDRGMWPAPKYRQCTSVLKKGPIYKFMRHAMKKRGADLAVNCTGIRAEESPARRKKTAWKLNTELSKAGRKVYEWMPIHDWTSEDVYNRIYAEGQRPFHAYGTRGEKNQRLSCTFCIMGSVNDHRNAAKHYPELYRKLVNLEMSMGHTMFFGKSLEERNNLTVEEAFRLAERLALN